MVHCCVKNCDTDENVVNCTSVFFVSLPSDVSLRLQWLEVLANSLNEENSIDESSKVCSCHFADDAFGKHPVHGYRFLLPDAVPSVFPVSSLEALLPPSLAVEHDPVEEDLSTLVDGFVEEESHAVIGELITFQAEEPAEVDDFHEEEPAVSDPGDVDFDPEDDLLEPVPEKTIGIEFANGKYYFLQSEDESEDELVERDSQISLLGTSLRAGSLGSLPEDTSIILEEQDIDQDKDTRSEYEMIVNEEANANVEQEEDAFEDQIDGPDDHVSTELDSLITTSEFVEEDGFSTTSNVEQVVVKEEDLVSEYFIDFLQNEHTDDRKLVQFGRASVEPLDEGGTFSAGAGAPMKEKKVNKHFCIHCHKGFQYESGLKKHLLVHSGQKPHTCQTCGKSFSQKINLTVHLRRHTGEETIKKFSCPVCDKKCIRMSELKLHMKTHWRKHPHACPLCTDRFGDITNFYEHIKSMHKEELTLQEAIDMIAQNENAELIVPGDEECPVLDETMLAQGFYTCSVCVKTFKTERALRKHKRKMHPKVYVCMHCPKQFLYKSLLEKHSRVHTQEKPFICDVCKLAFSQKINLEVHLVKKHKVVVNGKIAQKHLPCPECSKLFDRPSALTSHMRTHNREKPFCCRDCPKAFTSNSALASHIKLHHRGESILLHPAKRLSMAASVEESILAPDGVPSIPGDLVSVTASEDVNVIQYSIRFITPSEQGDVM